MDEEDIEEKLIQISEIHSSFTHRNPLTYIIFLDECKNELSEEQIKYCNEKIEKLKKKQNKLFKSVIDQIDNEISRLPLEEKIGNEQNNVIKIN